MKNEGNKGYSTLIEIDQMIGSKNLGAFTSQDPFDTPFPRCKKPRTAAARTTRKKRLQPQAVQQFR